MPHRVIFGGGAIDDAGDQAPVEQGGGGGMVGRERSRRGAQNVVLSSVELIGALVHELRRSVQIGPCDQEVERECGTGMRATPSAR